MASNVQVLELSLSLSISLCRWLPMTHHRTKMRTQWLIWWQVTATKAWKVLLQWKINLRALRVCHGYLAVHISIYIGCSFYCPDLTHPNQCYLISLLFDGGFFLAFANNESIATISLPKRKFPIFSFRPYIQRKGDVFISS